jgi:mono/diheme cytochrome c family protein
MMPRNLSSRARLAPLAVAVLALVALGACRQDMHDQPKYEAYEASAFFDDGKAARTPPAGTVARGHMPQIDAYHTGYGPDDQLVANMPVEVTPELLAEGQRRFTGFCMPCHGPVGDGRGMVVQRGYKQPASFHESRLVNSADGYFFDAITNGFGQMPSYASQIRVEDRWAIVAYVRALQLSQNAPLSELPDNVRQAVLNPPAETAADAHGDVHGDASGDAHSANGEGH